jgi:glycosyltransferase involved in cell wall biosynthesis
MKFSICIPNYNYERYLGRTIQSVLDQNYADLEIVVSDNASTDGSVALVRKLSDPRIRLHVNQCNIGFAGNLDQAARMASGDRLLTLSSDDLMGADALPTYERLLRMLPDGGDRAIISSAVDQIDADDGLIAHLQLAPPPFLLPEDRVPSLEAATGVPVYRVTGPELLRRSILGMLNPVHFASTTYPRRLYEAVGGYGGSRLINPDKWFHWRLLAVAEEAYFIDRPLFCYRWHASNQTSQQKRSGALKFLVDEYCSSIELSDQILTVTGLKRTDLERAFVEFDIARNGWARLAKDNAHEARRVLNFGRAVYPEHTRRNLKAQLLRLLLPFGFLAHQLARMLYRINAKHFRTREGVAFVDDTPSLLSASSKV